MGFKLIRSDCLVALKKLRDNSIDSIVTDPPYHLISTVKRFGKKNSKPAKIKQTGSFSRISKGFMGEEWDSGDIAFSIELWSELLRVLKPGGHVLAFSAPKNYHKMASAIGDSGFCIRDMINWITASGFTKSHDIALAIEKKTNKSAKKGTYASKEANDWKGWGTSLKPSHEPIVLAQKPIKEKTIADNVLKYNTGGINIEKSIIPFKGKKELKINHQNLIRNSKARDKLSYTISGFKDASLRKAYSPELKNGRIPANLIANQNTLPEKIESYFYCPKISKKERMLYADNLNTHPTVKPIKLMEYLVRMVTPPNGLVLDPFMGSGSTGIAALHEGFNFIGIEKHKDYFKTSKNRIKNCYSKIKEPK